MIAEETLRGTSKADSIGLVTNKERESEGGIKKKDSKTSNLEAKETVMLVTHIA